MKHPNPLLLVTAREAAGLSQVDLARRSGIAQGRLSKYENGLTVPDEETLRHLARSLEVPVALFYEPIRACALPISYHRRRVTTPIGIVRKLDATANLLRMRIQRLLRQGTIDVRIPKLDLDTYGSPEAAATAVRTFWRMARGPVPNMVKALEDAGAVVVALDFGTDRIDAVSFWLEGEQPLILLNSALPGSRSRFSLAHELGHLVLHDLPHPEMEREADRFASEFLLPAQEVTPYLSPLNLDRLLQLKGYWRVSMQCLLTKAGPAPAGLGLLPKAQHTTLWRHLSAAGYRRREPGEFPQEQPSLLREVVERHMTGLGYSFEDVAGVMLMAHEQLRPLIGVALAEPVRLVPRGRPR